MTLLKENSMKVKFYPIINTISAIYTYVSLSIHFQTILLKYLNRIFQKGIGLCKEKDAVSRL